MKWFLAGLMAVVLSACGCSTVGCGDDIRIDAKTLAQWAGSDSFTVEVCVNGECDTPLEVSHTSSLHSLGFPIGADVTGEVEVDVTVSAGPEVKHASGAVELYSYRPNGRFCSPSCSGADITIDGNSVRQAEPGLIPPRD
jgi:hypothetical protein